MDIGLVELLLRPIRWAIRSVLVVPDLLLLGATLDRDRPEPETPPKPAVIGSTVPVLETFAVNGRGGTIGQVELFGESWEARAMITAAGLQPGALVRIDHIEGTVLTVTPVRKK